MVNPMIIYNQKGGKQDEQAQETQKQKEPEACHTAVNSDRDVLNRVGNTDPGSQVRRGAQAPSLQRL